MRLAVKRLDKAAAKGIIHPNQAARRKSRLMKTVNAPQADRSAIGRAGRPDQTLRVLTA